MKLEVLYQPLLRKLIVFGVLIWFAFGFLSTLSTWKDIVVYPGEIDFTEGVTLYEANQLREGHSIYPGRDDPLFVASNFGPLFYILHGIASSFEPDSFFPNRVLSLCGIAMLAFFVGFFTYRSTKSKSAVAFSLFLAVWPFSIIVFGPSLKPDSLALGFIFAGLSLALIYLDSKLVFWAIPFFVIAFFIKQTSLIAPTFIVILLLLRDFKKAVKFVAWGTALALLLFAAFCLHFGAQNFVEHFVFYNVSQSFDAKDGFVYPYLFFLYSFWPLILLSVFSAFYIRNPKLLIYPLLCFLFHIWLWSKAGGFINYWSELLLSIVLPIPLATARLLKGHASSAKDWIMLILLLGFFVFDKNLYYYKHPTIGRISPTEQSLDSDQKLSIAIEKYLKKGKILVYASNPGLIVRKRKRVVLISDDPFLMTQQIRSQKRDEVYLLDLIKQKEIDLILLVSPQSNFITDELLQSRVPPAQLSLIAQNYEVSEKLILSQYYDYTYGNIPTKAYAFFLVPK